MAAQLSFAGFDPQPQPKHRLFFALFPDTETAERIGDLARRLAEKHELRGEPVKTARFHITLNHIGDHDALPEGLVRQASHVGEAMAEKSFDVTLDRIVSFRGRPGNRPLVLRGGNGVAAVAAFQQALAVAMKKGGLGQWAEWTYVPHLTLLYDDCIVAEETVDPIGWRTTEFVLIHSLLGENRHIPLARWPLKPGDAE